MHMAAKVLVLRATFAVRRGERHRRRQLERELAGYATPAERLEIESILDRYPAWQTAELRAILARQGLQARTAPTGPAFRAT